MNDRLWVVLYVVAAYYLVLVLFSWLCGVASLSRGDGLALRGAQKRGGPAATMSPSLFVKAVSGLLTMPLGEGL